MIECRAAAANECTAAAQLREEMAREFGDDPDVGSENWRSRFCTYFGGKQAAGNGQLFLAYDEGVPIGCATITIAEEWRRYCFGTLNAHVNAVYVKPAYRRRGIAVELMRLAIAWARDRGCKRVRLRSSDEGRRLYEGLGFRAGREMELDL